MPAALALACSRLRTCSARARVTVRVTPVLQFRSSSTRAVIGFLPRTRAMQRCRGIRPGKCGAHNGARARSSATSASAATTTTTIGRHIPRVSSSLPPRARARARVGTLHTISYTIARPRTPRELTPRIPPSHFCNKFWQAHLDSSHLEFILFPALVPRSHARALPRAGDWIVDDAWDLLKDTFEAPGAPSTSA